MSKGDSSWREARRAWEQLADWFAEQPQTGEAALGALRDVGAVRRMLDQAELAAVLSARRQGSSWAEVATMLGVTRQSAWEKWRDLDAGAESRASSSAAAASDAPVSASATGAGDPTDDVRAAAAAELAELEASRRSGPRARAAAVARRVGGRRNLARVPNTVGRTLPDARALLRERGLVTAWADGEQAALVAVGGAGLRVRAQAPEHGAHVERGTAVRLWVRDVGGGGAGVREPRRPTPSPRAGHAVHVDDAVG